MSDRQDYSGRDHSESALKSLAPNYIPEQHETYLKRLQAAVLQPSNRNIALTGSYGTGKSSILDEFCRRQDTGTLRLSISTLGATNEDTSLTNRLQKEVVKQLLYSTEPKALRNSRFKRIRSLSSRRAALEAVVTTVVVGLLLFMTGNLPSIVGTEAERHLAVRILAWFVAGAATALVVMVARLATFDRFVVSTVGGAVTLKQDTTTYFDEYLDEIVHYFDSTDTRIVVFEDLDRFDDPQIFEALRELNELLNNTERRRTNGLSLRFIYAVKDSLFEQLGRTEGKTESDPAATARATSILDAAVIEVERANRTKFFDLVIPVVPFISHRNARELLANLLTDAQITEVDRKLVDIVAKHITDMRLLVNLCNEYLVFAERLLDSDRVAPDLTASNLFALVAYKMFHMEDFERITRKRSTLDRLYADSRDIINRAVADRRKRLRELERGRARSHARADRAQTAGARLSAVTNAVRKTGLKPQDWGNQTTLLYEVAGTDYDEEAVTQVPFWRSAAHAGVINIIEQHPNGRNRRTLFTLTGKDLATAVPEASTANDWDDIDDRSLRDEIAQLRIDIARFRGAGFKELLNLSDSFNEALDEHLTSQMARELVRQGYLTRHFATYAAQFYGDFTGVDVVTFIMQTVETNSTDVEYEFSTDGAVANLLAETGEGFTKTVSALNIDVLDHLLEQEDPRRDDIAQQVIERPGQDTREFLTAYLSSGADPEGFVARLAVLGWAALLPYLAENDTVPEDARSGLFDAALCAPAVIIESALTDAVRDLVIDNHTDMAAFTTAHEPAVVDAIASLVTHLDWSVADLSPLSEPLRQQLIADTQYEVTAGNLRFATGETDITLDELIQHPETYTHALATPALYLDAIHDDPETAHAIQRSETLTRVLEDVVGDWDARAVARLLESTSAEASLSNIRDAHEDYWDVIADADLVDPSLGNVNAFLERDGTVTAPLGGLLRRTMGIDLDHDEDGDLEPMKSQVAVAVINATEHIESLDDRIAIVQTLDPLPQLPVDRIQATDATLLAKLLSAGIISDSLDTFAALRPPSWEGMDAALRESERASEFVTPEVLEGHVQHVLRSPVHRTQFGSTILASLASFVPHDDREPLSAAAEYALETRTRLPLDEVRRIARTTGDPELTVRMLSAWHLKKPSADLVAVLAELGTPYSRLIDGGSDFDVPYEDDFRAVFEQLKTAGLCERRKRRLRNKLQVIPTL